MMNYDLIDYNSKKPLAQFDEGERVVAVSHTRSDSITFYEAPEEASIDDLKEAFGGTVMGIITVDESPLT
jgi:hypothetical protein